jgi:hypothetical protein
MQSLYKAWKANSLPVGIIIFMLSLSSCEKVIDVDLNSAEKKYVIEANLTNQPGSAQVLLTQTKNFDENNAFNGISGAQVTIADNNDSPIMLAETAPGVYEAPALTGVPGHTYRLNVQVNGQAFTATTIMPAIVPFDSLFITEREFFGETTKYATVVYTDPGGIQNAYRFIQYVNDVREETNFVRDDDSNDGLRIERTLLYFYDDDEEEDRKIKSGDNVRVEMLGISYPVYKYWYSLSQGATGGSDSATPGNPVTNIQGGALGYFSAHTVQSKTVIVP